MTQKTAKRAERWFDFDTLEVPFDLGTFEWTPPPEIWERYRNAIGDPRNSFITNAIRPRSLATYAILAPRPGEQHINSGHEAQYFNPPRPGKKLIISATIADKYIRRGKPFIVTETEVKDEDGLMIERYRRISMVRSAKLGEKWWAKPTRDTEIGAELEPVVREFTLEKMQEFENIYGMASGRESVINFHSDVEAAATAGLRQPIASAHMTISYMHVLLNKFFGPDWVKGGTLSLRFIRPIAAGDTVAYKGLVKEKSKEGDRVRLGLQVWSENQRGQQTSVGTASALVD